VGNHRVTFDGDGAKGDTYCIAHHLSVNGEGVPTNLEMLVRYSDVYARDGDGWLIARRTVGYMWTRLTPVDASGLS
jgi:hypothetical protein